MTAQPRATASLHDEERFCALHNGVRLCYCTRGRPSAEPLVLIAGLGLDLTWWPAAFIDGLVARGFYVICFDSRDAGRSTHMSTRPPGLWRQAMRRPRTDGYDLTDMADDVVGLLDACGLSNAHVVGMSMGGMIGQMLAATHPSRVRTLTSVFSTTGARGVGGVAHSTLWRLARPRPRDERTAVESALGMARHISKGPHPFDEQEARAYAERAFRRGGGVRANAGFARQINAILKSGNRTAALRRITAPTLVLHGDVDRMVHPSGGHATAAAIPGAKHVTVRGMRHSFAREVVPQLIDLIASHAGQQQAKRCAFALPHSRHEPRSTTA
jgi:pimeloyl-ACP methyl ester carboxylesterase